MLETLVKRDNASKFLSNLFIMFSDLGIMSTMFVFIDFIYVCTYKISKLLVYKLHDLSNIYRSMSCAIFLTLDIILGILLTNMCVNVSAISTGLRCI